MSRLYPGDVEAIKDKKLDRIDGQLGMIVNWRPTTHSHVYSPISGCAIIPSISKRLGPQGVGDYIYYNEYSINCVVPPARVWEWFKPGSFVKYDCLKNNEGIWVAINIEFIGTKFPELHMDTDCSVAADGSVSFKMRAVVTNVDLMNGSGRVWLWNDKLGRIFSDGEKYGAYHQFDEVICTVKWRCDESWGCGVEDIPWCATGLEPFASTEATLAASCKKLASSDGWQLVQEPSERSKAVLVNAHENLIAYSDLCAFGGSIDEFSCSPASRYRVTYVGQLGSGIPFKRALSVTPVRTPAEDADDNVEENDPSVSVPATGEKDHM